MKIKEIPKNDRPRERVLNSGISSLSNEELVALILKTGSKKLSAKELALLIISKYDEIKDLKNITLEELNLIPGIGLSKASSILAALELSKRINTENKALNTLKFNNPISIYEYYKEKVSSLKQEHFYCLYLDNKKCIIKERLLYIGTINQTLIHPRDIFKEAYLLSATSIICIHNHPSGNVKPSNDDFFVTKNLIEIGKIMGVSIVDHIIVSSDAYYSFFENGNL